MRLFVVGSFVLACSVKVARLPRGGESLAASAFVAEPGGKGFNVALAAHRLGAAVDGAFAIGGDAFGRVAREAFRSAGLPLVMLVEHEGSTGAGIGFIDASGENCIAVSQGANARLGSSDVRRAAALEPGGLCIATFESPDGAIGTAFEHACACGATTLLNPSPSRSIDPAILRNTQVLVVNEVEAGDLGLTSHPGALDDLMRRGPTIVVITQGAAGATAFRKDLPPLHQAAFPVSAVDTIGAGDAFTAGLAVCLVQGRPLADGLRRAAACGALTAARLGAFEAFPTADELACFLTEPDLGAHTGSPGPDQKGQIARHF
jgi:ribokinase